MKDFRNLFGPERYRASSRAAAPPLSRTASGRTKNANVRLEEVHGFGSNPGSLRMFRYVPSSLPRNAALVVILHGCTQSAEGYDRGAGWSTLAESYGFALVLPQQQPANNSNSCFNWFQPADTRRGHGEALSIRQMIEKMVTDRDIDPQRIYITGLSAGGAMTSVMLACYPEVFAGGAIIAGLPYGAASSVHQAFESMSHCPPRSARQWAELVLRASPQNRRWPRVSVWHGAADKVVAPSNAGAIVSQWTAIHDLPAHPSIEKTVDGYRRQVWANGKGEELVESYTIANMAHGTPLAAGEGDGRCGTPGPFLLEAGISSSHHIAKFFGIADPVHRRSAQAASALNAEKRATQLPPKASRIDIGALIVSALKAAGIMKP